MVINDGLDSISLNFIEDGGVLQPIGWDRTLGGTLTENPRKILPLAGGGYLLIGHSDSNASGDRTDESRGLTDGWVVKIDTNGSKVWDKAYGGSERDYLYDGAQTDDGGFLLAGYSQSDVSGEKSANSKGSYDYWIIKIDANGNKLWDKTIGGDKNDYLRSITQMMEHFFLPIFRFQ